MNTQKSIVSTRQLATVIDLNKCMGCQTCVVSCKNIWTNRDGTHHMRWMNVATAPGPLYPRNFEKKGGGFDETGQAREGTLPNMVDSGDNFQFNHDEVFYRGNGQTVKLQPTSSMGGKPSWGYNWEEDQGSGEWPNPYFFYLPRKCNHCTNPACVAACSRNAIVKREQDGIVLINQERCEGHRHCVEACPYKMVFFNPVTQKSEKCIECFPRIEKGIATACNRQCPGRTRAYGYLDDENSLVHKLVTKWKVAIPLHPEYGTQPNVYYVPPLSNSISYDEEGNWTSESRIPSHVLEGYFGKDVHRSIEIIKKERENRKAGQESELMDLLISKNWFDRFSVFTKSAIEQ